VLLAIVAGAHLAVVFVRRIGRRVMASRVSSSLSKIRSITSLGTSIAVFILYFGAIGSVVNYPKGYLRCIIDVTLSDDEEISKQMERRIEPIVTSATEQFAGILVHPPSIEGRIKTSSGKSFLRVKYRIWPGRGAPFETTFKQEIIQSLKTIAPSYADWMVTVNFEVEKKPIPIASGTKPPR